MLLHKKYSCKFRNCINSYYWSKNENKKIVNKRFFRFPKHPQILVKWKEVCGINIDSNCLNKFMCEDHISEQNFVNSSKHLLNPNVVPKQIVNSIPVEVTAPFENNRDNNNIISINSDFVLSNKFHDLRNFNDVFCNSRANFLNELLNPCNHKYCTCDSLTNCTVID